ncbi:hypothetical protein V3C99_003701 [Haemonchus contortus]
MVNVSTESYCERMCSLMRRSGRAQLIVWDRSGRHPVDPVIDTAAEMFRGLEIDNKYSMKKSTSQRKPVLYIWASRGKCAPYAVPRRIRPSKNVEDPYSVMQQVRLRGIVDAASLRLSLMSLHESGTYWYQGHVVPYTSSKRKCVTFRDV